MGPPQVKSEGPQVICKECILKTLHNTELFIHPVDLSKNRSYSHMAVSLKVYNSVVLNVFVWFGGMRESRSPHTFYFKPYEMYNKDP